jgi:hypothetical protein
MQQSHYGAGDNLSRQMAGDAQTLHRKHWVLFNTLGPSDTLVGKTPPHSSLPTTIRSRSAPYQSSER